MRYESSEFSSEILAKGIFSFTENKIPTHSVQTPLKHSVQLFYATTFASMLLASFPSISESPKYESVSTCRNLRRNYDTENMTS